MGKTYLEPTDASAVSLFRQNIQGEVIMLNLLRFRDVADYTSQPDMAPNTPISGKQAFQKYIDHTLPFLEESGGEILFLGEAGHFFIGPDEASWDAVMVIKQRSVQSFMAIASNQDCMAGIAHRTAALSDSRLLPIRPCQRLVA